MREDELLNAAFGREGSGLGCGEVPVSSRESRVAPQKSRLGHQHMGIANVLGQSFDSLGIADDDELLSSLRRSENPFGIDARAVRQDHRPSFGQLLAHRTVRHAEGREPLWTKMTPRGTLKGEPQTIGLAVADRKAVDS